MQHTDLGSVACPIARSLERVGHWWSMLILRDCFHGLTRFDEFEKSLGIAPNMLTRRLQSLIEDGLLERRPYSAHPPRSEYVLTQCGQDFRPVMLAMLAWGNKYFAPEGISLVLVDQLTGTPVDPVMVDGANGAPITGARYSTMAGPAASARMLARLAVRQTKKAGRPDPA